MIARSAYITREAAVSGVINAAISAGFALTLFGPGEVPVWGVPGFVGDFVPQGFMVGLMGSLVPALLARRAIGQGRLGAIAGKLPRPVPAALLAALASAALATVLAAACAWLSGQATIPFALALAIKTGFGGALGALVTTLTLARMLR